MAEKPNRKYSRRSIAFDEFRRKQVSIFGGRAIPAAEHLMVLEDHLDIAMRRRNNAYPLFKLQMALLTDLITAEKAVADCKKKIEDLKTAPAEAADIEAVSAEQQRYTALRRALRDIGDGIAWRLLEYDRAALVSLASHARKPHINIEGLPAELNAFADIWNSYSGSMLVLNDLTHFLKKADITVRRDANHFEFVEVKSSRTKSGTMSRQKADLAETLAFLNEQGGERHGETVRIRSLPVRPKGFFNAVCSTIREAEKEGTAWAKIGEHLTVEFIDWSVVLRGGVEEPDMRKIEESAAVAEKWGQAGDVVTPYIGAERYLFVRNVAPYSIFPFSGLQRVKLMTNTLMTMSRLNVSAVTRYIASQGWTLVHPPEFYVEEARKVLNTPPDDTAETAFDKLPVTPLATFKKGALTLDLPATWAVRLAQEYLAPRTVLDVFESLLRAGPSKETATLINFDGESDQWD